MFTQASTVPPLGVESTPRGGAVNCTPVKILEKPFRSQRTLSAHPSQLETGVERIAFAELSPYMLHGFS